MPSVLAYPGFVKVGGLVDYDGDGTDIRLRLDVDSEPLAGIKAGEVVPGYCVLRNTADGGGLQSCMCCWGQYSLEDSSVDASAEAGHVVRFTGSSAYVVDGTTSVDSDARMWTVTVEAKVDSGGMGPQFWVVVSTLKDGSYDQARSTIVEPCAFFAAATGRFAYGEAV